METTAVESLAGLCVAMFESRMAGEMADLIARQGGKPLPAPSMREVPLVENSEALEFARRLLAGEFDIVIFLTGVGAQTLMRAVEGAYPREEFLMALRRTMVVARGPKPTVVLRSWDVPITLSAAEPNTWHQVLEGLDQAVGDLRGKRIAVQEYGGPNPELVAGLEQRGAAVFRVPVYQWALPENIGPLRAAIDAIIAGRVDVAMFTSATQVNHLMAVVQTEGKADALRRAFRRVVVGSVGPTCTEALRAHGLPVDVEPEHPKMGHLVREVGQRAALLVKIKKAADIRQAESRKQKAEGSQANSLVVPAISAPFQTPSALYLLPSSPFLRACRREPTDSTPIWLMRQAGRYMAEYRRIRAKVPFLELCKTPDLAAEVTVTAAERLGVDAAIIFADILLVLEPMGVGLEFSKGEGPVIRRPVREMADVDRLQDVDPEELSYVYEAIRRTRAVLDPKVPLIGFAGAPFTVASYVIEGSGSRQYQQTKAFMYRDPGAWHALMERLVRTLTAYLNRQIAAGAQAVQLFDSWVGCLSPDDYRDFVLPHSRSLIAGITPGVPVIHFGTDTASLLEAIRDAGGDVIGLDWRVNLDDAWDRLGPGVAVQGNLDPVALFAPIDELVRRAHDILKRAAGRPGHIFNLGHGILPQTPVDHVRALIDAVHEYHK